MKLTRSARCPECSSKQVRDTGYLHNDERTFECEECGAHFEESDA